MIRRALLLAIPAAGVAYAAGFAAGGHGAGLSALLGVVIVAANFALHGLSLAWASGVSVTAVQAVALGGFVVRMGLVLGAMFLLDLTTFFSPLVFGLAAISATFALLTLEATLVHRGVGSSLDIPPDPAAAAAAEALRLREGVR
jgi:hypothetical protein